MRRARCKPPQTAIQATYGHNHKRLAQIEMKYDADNLFRVNQNIVPAVG
jgi:hypothetical protein